MSESRSLRKFLKLKNLSDKGGVPVCKSLLA